MQTAKCNNNYITVIEKVIRMGAAAPYSLL